MGTRHLICAVSDNKYRIAQYGQWDGYPGGQGLAVLTFLKSPMIERLKQNLNCCSWITDNEYNKRWEDMGVDTKQRYAFVHFHAERGLAAAQLCGILFGFRQGTFSNAQGQSKYQAGGSLP